MWSGFNFEFRICSLQRMRETGEAAPSQIVIIQSGVCGGAAI